MRVGDLDTGERLLTSDEVAARLGIGRRTLLSYLSDRRGTRAPTPDVHVAGRALWLESTVDRWLG